MKARSSETRHLQILKARERVPNIEHKVEHHKDNQRGQRRIGREPREVVASYALSSNGIGVRTMHAKLVRGGGDKVDHEQQHRVQQELVE